MLLRNIAELPNYQRTPQDDGTVGYFFGNTTIIVRENKEKTGRITLTPIRGDQIACGEWYELWDGALEECCKLLEIAVNKHG